MSGLDRDSYTKPYVDYYDVRAESSIRNVGKELEFFKFVFDSFAKTPVGKILDVGCGTGRHCIPLMQEGYEVTGLDLSQNMLDVFKKKSEAARLEPRIFSKDMKEIDFAGEFDAIICMNSAFGYLLTDEDILQTLKAFHRALKPGGIAIIDLMNFLSLLGRYKESIIRSREENGVSFKQAVRHSVENVPGIWNHYEFGVIENDGQTVTYHELHKFRMLNYNEMRRFLNEAGFTEIRCFGEFAAREEVGSNARRLIFAAIK